MKKYIETVKINNKNITNLSLDNIYAFTYEYPDGISFGGSIKFLTKDTHLKFYEINFIYDDAWIVEKVFNSFFKPFAQHLKEHSYLFVGTFDGWKIYSMGHADVIFIRNEYVKKFEEIEKSINPESFTIGTVIEPEFALKQCFEETSIISAGKNDNANINNKLNPRKIDDEKLNHILQFYRHEQYRKRKITKKFKKSDIASISEEMSKIIDHIIDCSSKDNEKDRSKSNIMIHEFNKKWKAFIKNHSINTIYHTNYKDIPYTIKVKNDKYVILIKDIAPITKVSLAEVYIDGWSRSTIFKQYKQSIKEFNELAKNFDDNLNTFESKEYLYGLVTTKEKYMYKYDAYMDILQEITK